MADLPSLKAGHTRITEQNLGQLTIKGDELYWNNDRIVVKRIGFWQWFKIALLAVPGIIGGVFAFFTADLDRVEKNLCLMGIAPFIGLSCKKAEVPGYQTAPTVRPENHALPPTAPVPTAKTKKFSTANLS
jgi:hypothetical protein